ncbi:MAG: hypothetical protein VKK80_00455 [Prochlorothrix sp.]|nr:hypothetical protein [Prochlorothrix sp.]
MGKLAAELRQSLKCPHGDRLRTETGVTTGEFGAAFQDALKNGFA